MNRTHELLDNLKNETAKLAVNLDRFWSAIKRLETVEATAIKTNNQLMERVRQFEGERV